MITAQQALERLRAGNQRFVDGQHGNLEAINPARRDQLATGQEPFAVILGCSDSRVPPELLFDQGLGDLFVIRVAGNIVSDDETGSVEFAVQAFNTPLVIVLGHSSCGAITSAVDALEQPDAELPTALRSIVARVRPAVESTLAQQKNGQEDRAALIDGAVCANVRASVEQLYSQSELLATRAGQGRLQVLGAQYGLGTGAVEFLDDCA